MVHLPALPGAPGYAGSPEKAVEAALRDARALAEGGADAVLIENFGDAPFHPGPVPPFTVAAMTAAVVAVRNAVDLPVGVNVLRNDGVSALAVAVATRARFVRVNVLTGARLADQGILQGIAHDLLRERARVGAQGVRILADVAVKHSAPLAPLPLAHEVRDALARGGADAVIVTGEGTGEDTPPLALAEARSAAGKAPVLVGSGVRPDTLPALLPLAGGFIVGTWLKEGGDVRRPVDPARVRTLVETIRGS